MTCRVTIQNTTLENNYSTDYLQSSKHTRHILDDSQRYLTLKTRDRITLHRELRSGIVPKKHGNVLFTATQNYILPNRMNKENRIKLVTFTD